MRRGRKPKNAPPRNELAWRLINLYGHNGERWMRLDKRGVTRMRSAFEELNIVQHLAGMYQVSVYTGKKTMGFFGVGAWRNEVPAIIDAMEKLGVPRELIYVSLGAPDWFHIEIFFERPLRNKIAWRFYELMLEEANLDPVKTGVVARPTTHSAVPIPLGVNPATDTKCWYVDRETLEPIEDPDYAFEIRRMPRDDFVRIVETEEESRAAAARALAEAVAPEPPRIIFTKDMAPNILSAPTKATRRILFYLAIECAAYGEFTVSLTRIGEMTRLSMSTVSRAVDWLVQNKYIGRVRGYRACTYTFPGTKKFPAVPEEFLFQDSVEIKAAITPESLCDIYLKALALVVRPGYLRKFMTGPEADECEVKLIEAAESYHRG